MQASPHPAVGNVASLLFLNLVLKFVGQVPAAKVSVVCCTWQYKSLVPSSNMSKSAVVLPSSYTDTVRQTVLHIMC